MDTAQLTTNAIVSVFIDRILLDAFGGAFTANDVLDLRIERDAVIFHLRQPKDSAFKAEIYHPWKYLK